MRRAVYPGSFDPVTNGHLDVIERARKLFDEVIVAVAHNDEKQPLFPLKERLDLLRKTACKIDNVRIAEFKGLLVEFAKAEKAGAVIRGLRAVSDFRAGNGRNSLRRTPALQRRSRCCRRGAVGERIAVAAGGAALRIVPGEICTRNSGAGLCGAHGADRAGGGRSYVIHARGSFAEFSGA